MIFQDLKLAFLDFDDTLAIHPSYFHTLRDEERIRRSILSDDPYKQSIAHPVFKSLIKWFQTKNISYACLTCTGYSMSAEKKQEFLEKHYGGMQVITCPQGKKDFMVRLLLERYNIAPRQALFIDDDFSYLQDVHWMGVKVLSTIRLISNVPGELPFEMDPSEMRIPSID